MGRCGSGKSIVAAEIIDALAELMIPNAAIDRDALVWQYRYLCHAGLVGARPRLPPAPICQANLHAQPEPTSHGRRLRSPDPPAERRPQARAAASEAGGRIRSQRGAGPIRSVW